MPWDLAIEVKYFRPLPSGSMRPMPQLFGTLLADLNKLAQMRAATRYALLVTDPVLDRYILRNSHELLPLDNGNRALIRLEDLERLSTTASANARSKGGWRPLEVGLRWSAHTPGELTCYAWEVTPIE